MNCKLQISLSLLFLYFLSFSSLSYNINRKYLLLSCVCDDSFVVDIAQEPQQVDSLSKLDKELLSKFNERDWTGVSPRAQSAIFFHSPTLINDTYQQVNLTFGYNSSSPPAVSIAINLASNVLLRIGTNSKDASIQVWNSPFPFNLGFDVSDMMAPMFLGMAMLYPALDGPISITAQREKKIK